MPDGWHIDPDTLRPEVTDEKSFRAAFHDDPALDLLVLLWTGTRTELLSKPSGSSLNTPARGDTPRSGPMPGAISATSMARSPTT